MLMSVQPRHSSRPLQLPSRARIVGSALFLRRCRPSPGTTSTGRSVRTLRWIGKCCHVHYLALQQSIDELLLKTLGLITSKSMFESLTFVQETRSLSRSECRLQTDVCIKYTQEHLKLTLALFYDHYVV